MLRWHTYSSVIISTCHETLTCHLHVTKPPLSLLPPLSSSFSLLPPTLGPLPLPLSLGDEASINFWCDVWLLAPLVDLLHILPNPNSYLQSKVCNFIRNFSWHIPAELAEYHPHIVQTIQRVTIPKESHKDIILFGLLPPLFNSPPKRHFF